MIGLGLNIRGTAPDRFKSLFLEVAVWNSEKRNKINTKQYAIAVRGLYFFQGLPSWATWG